MEKRQASNKSRCFIGDASRVVVGGLGLKKGFIGRSATFSVDVKDAGRIYFRMQCFIHGDFGNIFFVLFNKLTILSNITKFVK